ncbi:hypothetical protein STTU_4643 [Streptomyces sp. Tu6071]|uniref:hypothetical protein n=1 Tax=unclassified Streptomyces TaxID=2593676 RepID=UPI00020E5E6F|nr:MULTISPECIES: hypothetical protein [unclassified Streptomyces]EGJ77432.1 hypothetical protein STTU_4643 [Streptomyces sp. Tu6071]
MPSTPGTTGDEVVRLRLRVGDGPAAGEQHAAAELRTWLAGTTELTELATVEEVRLPRTAEETTPSLGFGDFWYDVLVNITPDLITAATVVLYRLLRSRQPRSEQEETVTIHFEDGSRHTLRRHPASNEEMAALVRTAVEAHRRAATGAESGEDAEGDEGSGDDGGAGPGDGHTSGDGGAGGDGDAGRGDARTGRDAPRPGDGGPAASGGPAGGAPEVPRGGTAAGE